MGIYEITKVSRGGLPILRRQFVSRHLCTALADPLLWHTAILWRQYAEKEDATQMVPAVPGFFFSTIASKTSNV